MDRKRQEINSKNSIGRLFKKPLWKENKHQSFFFYCPLCAASRRVPLHPKAGQPIHFVQIGLLTLIFMISTWGWFGIKGLVAFVPFWIAFEMLYRAKVRAALACKQCGFDPSLYLVDTQKAKEAVRAHWEEITQGVKARPPRSSLDSEEPRS